MSCQVLRGRLPRLQSTNSVGAHIPEQEVLAPFFDCALPCSLPTSPHVEQKEDPTHQGHCQQGTSSEKEL